MVRLSPAPTTAVDEGGATTISAVHPDVLLTHILSRLDGPTLASASCASSQLLNLSTQENLWSDICHSTWHSTLDPRMRHLISNFPNGPRSFFSDSFPLLSSNPTPSQKSPHPPPSPPPEIISAVDLHYKNKLIFSKVQETQTLTNWFSCSPFRIDLLDPKDVIPTSIPHTKNICQDLAENLTLSWIIVDPMGHRAANFSSWRPVSVQRHWLSGEIQVRFATILGGAGQTDNTTELVQCGILVAFGGCEDGDMIVREVSLQVEDMDGINLNGKDSLEILQVGIERGERKKGKSREERKDKYEKYLKMKTEREEMKLRRERRLDSMCIAFGLSVLTLFSMFVLYR
ncbi:hypothetical protein BVC80_1751g217 [Macleaya cordata]|uniref:F-box domain-containing protein n=1 Tax=Macleaya cordata TaxID=56857 RepID=A0A200QHX9_MACCD|nr:hypothetical protein BVC80_1751g217 [Macleaya cordata]